MAFKGAADKQSYLSRSASHSTKPRKTGDNSGFAERTYDVEYGLDGACNRIRRAIEIEKEIAALTAKWGALSTTATEINERLSATLPLHRFKALQQERRALGLDIQECQHRIQCLKRELRSIGGRGQMHVRFEAIFVEISRQLLPPDVFSKIANAANALARDEANESLGGLK